MESLNNQIIELKQRFRQKQVDQSKLRSRTLVIIEALLGRKTERYLKELHFKSGKLFLESRNKSAANELLFIGGQLRERVRAELGIEEIVIR